MIEIGERVDHGNGSVLGELIERALRKYTRDNSVNPLLQIFRDVLDTLAFAEACLGVVQKYRATAHALHSNIKSCARAQRGLFKNHGDEFSGERSAVAFGSGFHFRGKMQTFTHGGSGPFHSRD